MNSVYVILGSNIDKEINLPKAVSILTEMCRVGSVSSVYETAPVGLLDQPNFFNAVVHIKTRMSASQLKKHVLQVLETRLKRGRVSNKSGPRSIDADIVLFNDEIFDYDNRHIPDPDLLKYPHVAVPMAELAPDLTHPETGNRMSEIAQKVSAFATEGYDHPAPVLKRSAVRLL